MQGGVRGVVVGCLDNARGNVGRIPNYIALAFGLAVTMQLPFGNHAVDGFRFCEDTFIVIASQQISFLSVTLQVQLRVTAG
jgi:hypothetical protein